MKIKNFFVFEITFQVIVDMNRTYSGRSSCIKQVTDFQCTKPAYISDNPVYLKEHVARIAILHGLAVDIQMEIDVLDILKTFHRNPVTDSRRVVESLAQFPGFPSARNL